MKDGKPMYTYNFVGLEETTIAGSERIAPGKATIVMNFAYEGGRGKGGAVTLSVNGKQVGTGRLDRTEPNAFSADDLADVGVDEGTPGEQGLRRTRKQVHRTDREGARGHQVVTRAAGHGGGRRDRVYPHR